MTTQTDINRYEKENLIHIITAYKGEPGFDSSIIDNTDYVNKNSTANYLNQEIGFHKRFRVIDELFEVLDKPDKKKPEKYGKNSNGKSGMLIIDKKKFFSYLTGELVKENGPGTETYFFFRIKDHDKNEFKKYKLEKAMIILNLLQLLNKNGEEIKYEENNEEKEEKEIITMTKTMDPNIKYTALIIGLKLCGNSLSLKYRESYFYGGLPDPNKNGKIVGNGFVPLGEKSRPAIKIYPDICTETTPGPQADSPDYALGAAGEEDAKSHYADLNQPDTQGGRKQHFRRGTSSKCHKTHFSKKCRKTLKRKHFSKKCRKTLKRKHFSKKCHKTLKRKCKKTLKRK
jgi:hypothetical protein